MRNRDVEGEVIKQTGKLENIVYMEFFTWQRILQQNITTCKQEYERANERC